MSISGALSNAISGLTAASRSAEVVSTNIANAMTEGYGHRSVALSSRGQYGAGGVGIDGIVRRSDPVVLADRRLAGGQDANAQRMLGFFETMEKNIGIPSEPGSLAFQVAEFETSLIAAASMPNANERLQAVSHAAKALTDTFNNLSDGIQSARKQADQNISDLIGSVNANLQKIERLNVAIVQASANRQDTSALVDQRQMALDSVATIIPVRIMPRDNGQIGVYSTGGAALVDGKAAVLSFTASNAITAHTTLDGGMLSPLSVNGKTIDTRADGALGGGLLAAEFEIRDKLGVSLQSDLDAMARDLVERFQSTAMDPTLAPGTAGLFTDAGAAFSGTDATGLSGRLSINALADASQTNEMWRLRDGLGAVAPGAASDTTLLLAMKDQMAGATSLADASHLGGAYSVHAFASQLASVVGAQRVSQEDSVAFSSARLGALQEQEMAQGVDTDQEMQRLLLIEQTYAANARVIQVVDELMETLLGL